MQASICRLNLSLRERFRFLKIAKNPVGYTESGERNQCKAAAQIREYMAWFNENILQYFFKKYGLKLSKVELLDLSKPLTHFQVKIKQREDEESSTLFLAKLRIYRAKELNNVSDRVFQAFINSSVLCEFGEDC